MMSPSFSKQNQALSEKVTLRKTSVDLGNIQAVLVAPESEAGLSERVDNLVLSEIPIS